MSSCRRQSKSDSGVPAVTGDGRHVVAAEEVPAFLREVFDGDAHHTRQQVIRVDRALLEIAFAPISARRTPGRGYVGPSTLAAVIGESEAGVVSEFVALGEELEEVASLRASARSSIESNVSPSRGPSRPGEPVSHAITSVWRPVWQAPAASRL